MFAYCTGSCTSRSRELTCDHGSTPHAAPACSLNCWPMACFTCAHRQLAPHLTHENAGTSGASSARSPAAIESKSPSLAPADVPAAMRKLPAPKGRTDYVWPPGETSGRLRRARFHPYDTGRSGMPRCGTGCRDPSSHCVRRSRNALGMRVARAGLNRDQTRSEESARSVPEPGLDAAAIQLLRPGGVDGSPTSRATSTVSPASVLPLAPGRYKVQFTASATFRDKLERLRDLMQTGTRRDWPHSRGRCDREAGTTRSRRFATRRPPERDPKTDTSAKSRRIPRPGGVRDRTRDPSAGLSRRPEYHALAPVRIDSTSPVAGSFGLRTLQRPTRNDLSGYCTRLASFCMATP